MTKYTPTIGLEIHIELKTKHKMFCECLNDPEEKRPNLNICPICLAHPGVLPKPNKEAMEKVLQLGLALNCHLSDIAKFDRKNYFYPDLPKGYQISQYDKPFCQNGYLEISDIKEGVYQFKKIPIRRIHLEEDTARLIHEGGSSFVDFNRAGIPLAELVTEPEIHSAKEARRFCEELHLIIKYLDIGDADMEKGEMRCEVNISIAANELGDSSKVLGTKVEIKNLNSFRAVEEAIKYEIERQTEMLEKGEKVIQETRGWDEKEKKTTSQRIKEEAHDYRYFPEPDLKPIKTAEVFPLDDLQRAIPELPNDKRLRFLKEYGLKAQEVEELVYEPQMADYFEKVIMELDGLKSTEGKEREERIKLAYNYLSTDLKALMIQNACGVESLKITPHSFAILIDFLDKKMISSAVGKAVLAEVFESGANPEVVIKEKNLLQVFDTAEIDEIAKLVINQNPQAVADFKKGKVNALQFLAGQVMKESKGRFNPQLVQERIKNLLTN
ncbi:MAG TPA: Asp-tRNA(Asn)/Glu-tRNA(Gln) amidotransferase subunit GatB [Candidatus Paceibacterota bacterium]|nr:Asp-tRNA(Asn)/Glu-tRNA(Gln) amidotransferase subunit GatB [Candidatus Paceibacterota bacterium]HOL54161.1 Asp-tRNA(Asn)/Glu-tRNA(Gln) amidotransferase subunit GatB [Candidatus Paceibacterota bacterium]HPP17151.1 Asp-tRNA(Asn)/Glu-tRNA(Gln) amidotransferase subunit GatB [Candidatus Paceibacterota bacterium]